MGTVEKTVTVQQPVRTVYNQWTQFEEFPSFMDGVEQVQQVDDTHLRWRSKIMGAVREWDAEITEQQPDERIAWVSTAGFKNDGTVTFAPSDGDATQVTLRIVFDDEKMAESVANAMGMIDRRVEGDLERFKEFIEKRGHDTGAWRGEV